MFKIFIASSLLCLTLLTPGCGGAASNNQAANTASNIAPPVTTKVDPANMPPGISANEVRAPVNAPGIPANAGPLPKGATPTPGIPSEFQLKKPFKPGATPTPGIPDPETIRRALGQHPTNVNTPPPSNGTSVPMMKSTNRKLGGKP